MSRSALRVALAAMPWSPYNRPSIQLGALKAFLEQADSRIRVTCLHPYLAAARDIGPDRYQTLARHLWISEALFAGVAYPEKRSESLALAQRLWRRTGLPARELAWVANRLAESFNQWFARVPWQEYDLVGLSVCFNQLLASLATARRLKKEYPGLPIVFGGSALAPDMTEALAHHAGIDFCICGEGELPLLRLCRFLLQGENEIRLSPGEQAAHSKPPRLATSPAVPAKTCQIPHLDHLPVPDYGDYFAELKQVFGPSAFIPVLPVELSRGCWWRRCVFCNLNRQWRGYRAKSGERMARELTVLAQRHRCLDFAFADNALPRRPRERLFHRLANTAQDYRFFAELRATDAKSFPRLARGGLARVQVGIEALSNSLLARLGKGTTVLANVYAMKQAVEAGIALEGNLILEFPGTSQAEINETLAAINLLMPYPPLAPATFFLGADSPVAREPRRFGIRAVHAHPYLHRLLPFSLPFGVLAYRGDRTRQQRLWRPVREALTAWQQAHRQRGGRCGLTWRAADSFLVIRQQRPDGTVLYHRLTSASARIYRRLASPTPLAELCAAFPRFPASELRGFLDELARKGCVFRQDDTYLALATHDKGESI